MNELSQEQQAAVFTKSKNALCLAGAGSGKTRVLISRIQHLIENCQVSPYEVACMTFTRKAGTELKERLEKLIGNKAHNVTIGTLHSVALNHIQRFGEFIGLNPGKITVYSSWEESVLLKDVAIELGYHTGKTFKGVKKAEIEKAFYLWYTRKTKDENNYTANEIMDAFFMRCKENNALTYGMIMTSFHDLIPRIGRMLKYKHIMIDETQDLDKLQWKIVRFLCAVCDASLFAVGDQQQCIFQWRGSDPDYLIRNQEKFDVFKLCDNYRSDGFIVEAANKLIKNNQNRLDLEMNSIRDKLRPICHFKNMPSEEIAKWISDFIGAKAEHHNPDIAVLGRNHFLLDKLSTLLKQAGIDHEYIGKKTAFTRSEEFRRVHALLNLAVNPFDNFSFMICLDYLGVSRDSYKEIRMRAVKTDKSHFQVWREGEQPDWAVEYISAIDKESFDDVFEWMYGVDFSFDPRF